MKIKQGVELAGLRVPMRAVKVICEEVYKRHGHESVITSALEGKHSLGSYHPFGYALDYRIRFLKDKAEYLEVAQEIREGLKRQWIVNKYPKGYTVVLESTHIHIQYNK